MEREKQKNQKRKHSAASSQHLDGFFMKQKKSQDSTVEMRVTIDGEEPGPSRAPSAPLIISQCHHQLIKPMKLQVIYCLEVLVCIANSVIKFCNRANLCSHQLLYL